MRPQIDSKHLIPYSPALDLLRVTPANNHTGNSGFVHSDVLTPMQETQELRKPLNIQSGPLGSKQL